MPQIHYLCVQNAYDMRIISFIAALLILLPASAQRYRRAGRYTRTSYIRTPAKGAMEEVSDTSQAAGPDTLMIVTEYYRNRLKALTDSLHRVDSLSVPSLDADPSPYSYPILLSGTLYRRPIQQQMSINWKPTTQDKRNGEASLYCTPDQDIDRIEASNNILSRMYTTAPWYFQQTQQQLSEIGGFINDLQPAVPHEVRLAEKTSILELENDAEPVAVITRRPNFWSFSGNGTIHFQQNYFSDNWYQGGENNYSALTQLTLNLKYDNKQKIQWENKLEIQLGFQTSKSDTCHVFKPNSNLIRYTTKFSYRAAKNWSYTGQLQMYTQLVQNYNSNSHVVTTDILSPLNMTIGPGIDYKFSKKRFSGSCNIAPLAYNMKYVQRPSLATRYGVDEGHHSKHTFGPNITINYTWKIYDNIQWASRIYWFSNFKYTDIQWENTFTFTINKYLNTKLYVYPKFDDSASRYKGKHDYFMLKEWLSLGFNYSI